MNRETNSGTQTRRSRIIAIVTTFVTVFLAVFFGLKILRKPAPAGTISFAPNVSAAEQALIASAIPDLKLANDVSITAGRSLTLADAPDNAVVYDVLLPTTDFYDARLSIDASELSAVFLKDYLPEDTVLPTVYDIGISLTPVSELQPTQKVLAINDQYYLDTLNSGAVFTYLSFTSDDPATAASIREQFQSTLTPFPGQNQVLSFAQTGVTALSRRMNTALNKVGNASFFAEQIGGYLSSLDLTHTSNESSFSSAATGSNICSKPQMIDVLTTIGLDIVELTGNHNQDCGDLDAIATIDLYDALNIKTVGGGRTAAEAAIPLNIDLKDAQITLLAYNESTGGATTDDTPGANRYLEAQASADITAAKAAGRFVIVDVQYYECNAYDDTKENTTCDYANSSAGDQIGFFRHLIDLGADLVVGTSAHQPQTYELYGNGAIYYGLGNLFFDQSLWPGTTRSLILAHYFINGRYVQTRLRPTIYDGTFQTRLMDDADASILLGRLVAARPTGN